LKNNKNSDDKNANKYLNIPFQMLIVIGLGVFGGVQLDKIILLEFPVFTLILTVLSVVVAIYIVIKGLLK